LTHCAFLALYENHVRGRPGEAFGNIIREQCKTVVLLAGQTTLNKALRQTLDLEVISWESGLTSGFGKQVIEHCGGIGPC
jgi:hypothetical protein